jgi:hypothetical protein
VKAPWRADPASQQNLGERIEEVSGGVCHGGLPIQELPEFTRQGLSYLTSSDRQQYQLATEA